MAGDNTFLLCSLPALGELGSMPPISLAQFLEKVEDVGGCSTLLEVVFLSDDLLQRQAYLSLEREEVEPIVLTRDQATGVAPLPEYLAVSAGEADAGLDAIWEAYWSHAIAVAHQQESEFLSRWVRFEVGLRNALAQARAKALNLDPQSYMVAADLGDDPGDFAGLVREWAAAPDPFAGLKVLDRARWQWLWENDGWFTFGDDEVLAYGAKLMLLYRWHRLSRGDDSLESKED